VTENKTRPTKVSVARHIAAIANDQQRADAKSLATLLRRVTGQSAVMWGPSIIGFGRYHYRYDSGREGDSPLTGFAVRGNGFAIYVTTGFAGHESLLAKLGKYKASKACLYVKRLADIDLKVLEALVMKSVTQMKRRYADDPMSNLKLP
jgi:hypothetical protein